MAKPITGPGTPRDVNDNIIRQSQPPALTRRPFLSGGRVVVSGQAATSAVVTSGGGTGGSTLTLSGSMPEPVGFSGSGGGSTEASPSDHVHDGTVVASAMAIVFGGF